MDFRREVGVIVMRFASLEFHAEVVFIMGVFEQFITSRIPEHLLGGRLL